MTGGGVLTPPELYPFDYRAFGSFAQSGPPRDNVSKRIIKEDTHLDGTK